MRGRTLAMVAGATTIGVLLMSRRGSAATRGRQRMFVGPMSRPGVWMWLWPKRGWTPLEPHTVASDLHDLGVSGLIVQNGLADANNWLAHNAAGQSVSRVATFRTLGFPLIVGYGLDGGTFDANTATNMSNAIVRGIRLAGGAMLDWEKREWETPQGRALALRVSENVRRQVPDARGRVYDAPWWAPLFRIGSDGVHHPTHPQAPTREWGTLASVRAVQAYGAGVSETASRSMLAWARSPTQYPSLGNWDVIPSWQAYGRSVEDHVQSIMKEPVVCLWNHQELDANARTALRAVKVLRERGYVGSDGIRAFRQSRGLSNDYSVDDDMLHALGVLR